MPAVPKEGSGSKRRGDAGFVDVRIGNRIGRGVFVASDLMDATRWRAGRNL